VNQETADFEKAALEKDTKSYYEQLVVKLEEKYPA
jgi:hypothetical protein